MKNIAYHILDIVHNSIQAKADLVKIKLKENTGKNFLALHIEDNGKGMTEEEIACASDPYFTSRKTRNVGLGLPLLKQNAEQCGGEFSIESKVGEGTKVKAVFNTDNIDCPALGDIVGTIHSLITSTQNVDFIYKHIKDDKEFVLDTREIKKILEGVPLYHKEISKYIKEMIRENLEEIGVIKSEVI
jgi:hypothetical protein